jgi:dihydropyrimidine dehydrogenase (NAD+) subunit PreA
MADLRVKFCGIESPNPFWVASGPPANTGYQAHRAFEAGWGGVVWKTIGEPIVNTSSRYSAMNLGPKIRIAGFNNIELISDRSPETNFREIAEVKKRWPNHAVIASLMVDRRARTGTNHEALRRLRGGRSGAEFRLPARDVRAGHGIRGGTESGSRGDDRRLGDGSGGDSGHRETDAEHHECGLRGRAAESGRGRHLAHQHDQQHHERESRHVCSRAEWSMA